MVDGRSVEWELPSAWTVGTSKRLRDAFFDGQFKRPDAPARISLPEHPLLLDRVVEHIFLGTYHLDKGGKLDTIHNATYIPLDASAYTLRDVPDWEVHLRMYRMGEFFLYDALKKTAFDKLTDVLMVRLCMNPDTMHTFVQYTYATEPPLKKCSDDKGVLKNLAVVASIAHARKEWSEERQNEFIEMTKGYEEFVADVQRALDENQSIVAPREKEKQKEKGKKTK
ncbi:hypothetical protein CC80DRAFT_539670 [Byssothecium circinans]|uniref:BTB domain-containing protein n=1 Tax=Byssothecium circinans TaxID=147558 RepID=A0A6A5TNC2_9PLEO|nr:hypothetical protein CC80DRAFT_539670 [Byssothecium circinans]